MNTLRTPYFFRLIFTVVLCIFLFSTYSSAGLIGSTSDLESTGQPQQHLDTLGNVDFLIEKYLGEEVTTISIGKYNIPDSGYPLEVEGFSSPPFDDWLFEVEGLPGSSGSIKITAGTDFIGDIYFSLKAGKEFALYSIEHPSQWQKGEIFSTLWNTFDLEYNKTPRALSHISFWTVEVSEVPEPSTLILFGLALGIFGLTAKKRKKVRY